MVLLLMSLTEMLLSVNRQKGSPCDLWTYKYFTLPNMHQPHGPQSLQYVREHMNLLLPFASHGHIFALDLFHMDPGLSPHLLVHTTTSCTISAHHLLFHNQIECRLPILPPENVQQI